MIMIAQTEMTIYIIAIYETITHDDRVLPIDLNHLKNKARTLLAAGFLLAQKSREKSRPPSLTAIFRSRVFPECLTIGLM